MIINFLIALLFTTSSVNATKNINDNILHQNTENYCNVLTY